MRAEGTTLAALAVLVSTVGTAFASTPALEVTVPSASVRVGDRIPVRVSARGGEDLMWGELAVAVEAAGSWAVVEGPREVPGARPPAWELVLAPMDLGELPLPGLAAGVRDTDGGEAREVAATALPTVSVVSILPADQEVDPAPLKDPIGVSGFPWEWVVPLAFPVLGVAAALAWWARRRRAGGTPVRVIEVAPFEEFAALLDRLDGRIGREPAESICDRLAGGLRHYLERVSGEPAEDMTSFELRLLARSQEWPETVQRGIQTAMATADRVRFGRRPVNERELREALETSRESARALEDQLAAAVEEDAELEATG